MRACPVMAAAVRRPLVRRSPSEGNTTTAGETSTSQRRCQVMLLSTPDGVRTCTASFCTVIVVLSHLILPAWRRRAGVRIGHGRGAEGVHL